MTLTELRYIVALAKIKNFGRAAEQCFVSQPTLSVAVKKLEDRLNVSLFERGKNQVNITDIGQRIVQQAQRVLDEVAVLQQIADSTQHPLSQPLRIGAIYTVGPYLFPKLIAQVKQLAPELPLIVEENYTANLQQKLNNGELDAIIIALPFGDENIRTIALYDEPFDVVIPPQHAWQAKTAVAPDDFADETLLLLSEGNCFRDQVIAACPACAVPKQAKTPADRMLEGSSLETIRQMVSRGLGVSVFPRSSIQQAYMDKQLIGVKPFTQPEPYRQIAIAYHQHFSRPQAIEWLVKAVKLATPITEE